jgi:hypothetical protein
MRTDILGKLKKLIYLIGSRSRDLPTCSIVLQPLRYRVLPGTVKAILFFVNLPVFSK